MDPPSRLSPDDNTNMQKIYNFFLHLLIHFFFFHRNHMGWKRLFHSKSPKAPLKVSGRGQ